MGPLIELSAALDTQVPNAEALFRVGSSHSKVPLIDENGKFQHFACLFGYKERINGTGISSLNVFSCPTEDYDEYSTNYQNNRNNALSTISGIGGGGGAGPNGLSRKQEILVRSAIKYWVERHKHIVKYVWVMVVDESSTIQFWIDS